MNIELDFIRICIVSFFMWIVASCFSACGIAAGGMVAGSTGFLREYQARPQVADMDHYTPEEKKQLNAVISQRRY